MSKISKITLGTAQLGMKYGIANVNQKPDFESSMKILNYSWENGINSFDTAPTYGNSEEIIGSFISSKIKKSNENLFVVSKLPAIKKKANLTFDNLYIYIKKQILNSLNSLKLDKIPVYLLHHGPDIYLKNGLVINCLSQLKNEGFIDRFGISVYNPDEVETALKFKEFNVIQVPMNVFDHRLIKTRLLEKFKKKNYIVFVRSIYLQGLFFIPPKILPKYLKIAKEPLTKLHNLAKEYQVDIARLAFLFIRDLPGVTSLVVGAEKIEQIANNIKLLDEKFLPQEIIQRVFEEFSELPDKLINPSMWNEPSNLLK